MNKQDLERYRQQGASALVDAYERVASERDAEVAKRAIRELIKSEVSLVRLHNDTKRSVVFAQDASIFAEQYANQLRTTDKDGE